LSHRHSSTSLSPHHFSLPSSRTSPWVLVTIGAFYSEAERRWTVGDLTLVSANNRVVKVSSTPLQEVSPIFGAVGNITSGEQKIEFTPDQIESGDIVHGFRFLGRVTRPSPRRCPSPRLSEMGLGRQTWQHDIEVLARFTAFLKKNDSKALHELLLDLFSHEADMANIGSDPS
jgi:hypothetical protein